MSFQVDRVSRYADLVKSALASSPSPMSVPELAAATAVAPRLVREAIDRLLFMGLIQKRPRYQPMKRGTPLTEFALVVA